MRLSISGSRVQAPWRAWSLLKQTKPNQTKSASVSIPFLRIGEFAGTASSFMGFVTNGCYKPDFYEQVGNLPCQPSWWTRPWPGRDDLGARGNLNEASISDSGASSPVSCCLPARCIFACSHVSERKLSFQFCVNLLFILLRGRGVSLDFLPALRVGPSWFPSPGP